MTSQSGKQYTSCIISQEVKTIRYWFAQLIEYNIRKIFLEKSYKKYGGETILRPVSKKPKYSITLDQ